MALEIRLAEILGALSRALDLTEGQPAGHCVRCCWIGVNIGRAMGMPEADLRDLYYALLLKDLGCSSNAARLSSAYLTDDLTLKHDSKLLDGSLPQALRFVLANTGADSGIAERFRAVTNVLRNGGSIVREVIEMRCERGADIARQMRFSDAVAGGILDLDEHWDGRGQPFGLAGPAISLLARVALFAQVVEVFHASSGRAGAIAEATGRAGTWFDPAVVLAFRSVAAEDAFWEALGRADLEATVLAMEPGTEAIIADETYLDDIAEAFARVIDAKSPFTGGHSERVAAYTDMICGELGIEVGKRRWLRRAALLHDIGKLGVSNRVLDKPGKLDKDEWVAMRSHAALSEEILSRIAAFSRLAKVAGAHHERLDGRGYPRGLAGDAISFDTRIISAADVYDALTADRPYRPAMPADVAMKVLWQDAGPSLDPRCVGALERALGRGATIKAA